jgi:hypothetical protein
MYAVSDLTFIIQHDKGNHDTPWKIKELENILSVSFFVDDLDKMS